MGQSLSQRFQEAGVGGAVAGAAKRPPCLFSRSSNPGREEGDIAKSLRAKEKALGAITELCV